MGAWRTEPMGLGCLGRWAAGCAFVVAWLAVTALALMPAPAVPVTTLWDKADHVLAFLVLTLLGRAGLPGLATRLPVVLLLYGAAIELIQSGLPTRSGSLLDLVADAIGIGVALVLLALARSVRMSRLPAGGGNTP